MARVIEASAPGRAGIVGNPSDIYGGSVMSCATSQRARCRMEEAGRITLSLGGVSAVVNSATDLQPQNDALDIVRAVLRYLEVKPGEAGFALSVETNIPEQAGLAGSTALICCLASAVQEWQGARQHPHALVETARRIESAHIGKGCGFQDASMCIFGGLRYVDLRGRESLDYGPSEPYVTVEPLNVTQMPFLIAHSGVRHHSGSVHKGLRERWEEGEPAVVQGYARLQTLAALGKRAMLDANWPKLAACMTENHAIQRDLGGSGASNEEMIAAALDGGALAAKLAGAGGGGTIIALTMDPNRAAATLRQAGAEQIITLPANAPGVHVSQQ